MEPTHDGRLLGGDIGHRPRPPSVAVAADSQSVRRTRPTPGGKLVLDVNGVAIRGEYLVVEPPRRVVFTWGAAGSDVLRPGSTTVEINLHPDGGGTRVELAHRDLPPEEVARHGTGWSHFLERLVITPADGDPGPDPWATP